MEALVAAVGKIENPAILVLLLMCAGLAWAHIVWRKEEREDRQKMLEVFGSLKDAINEMRVTLAAFTGKPQ